MASNLETCRNFVKNELKARPIQSLDDLNEGQNVVVIANVRAQHVKVASLNRMEKPSPDSRFYEITSLFSGMNGTGYIILDYHGNGNGESLSNPRLDTGKFHISEEMVSNGRVYTIKRLPDIVETELRKYKG